MHAHPLLPEPEMAQDALDDILLVDEVESLAYRLYEDEGKTGWPSGRTLGSSGAIYSRRTPRHRLFFGKISFYPSGGLGLILVILLILLLMGRI